MACAMTTAISRDSMVSTVGIGDAPEAGELVGDDKRAMRRNLSRDGLPSAIYSSMTIGRSPRLPRPLLPPKRLPRQASLISVRPSSGSALLVRRIISVTLVLIVHAVV